MAFPATQPIPNQEDTSAPIATEDGKLNLSNRVKDVPSAASLYQQMWQEAELFLRSYWQKLREVRAGSQSSIVGSIYTARN